MSNQFQVSIANPCHENWNKMNPAEKGRFCDSCKKQVMDFTNMSDSQLAAFFKKQSYQSVDNGSICGRFYSDQLNRDILIPKKRMPWIKYFFQFAIPAFLLSARATAQGNISIAKHNNTKGPRDVSSITSCKAEPLQHLSIKSFNTMNQGPVLAPAQIFSLPIKAAPQLLIAGNRKIDGTIMDADGLPLPGASIIVKDTRIGAVTNAKGEFAIDLKDEWNVVTLEISAIGYSMKEVTVSNENVRTNIALDAKLERLLMGKVSCVRPKAKKQSKPIPLMTQKLMDTAFKFFKIFPNPVMAGTSLHIEWKQSDEGYYTLELIDLSGKNLFSKEIWIDAEARLLTLEIPSVAGGNYFLRATNRQTGKNYTEKILIE